MYVSLQLHMPRAVFITRSTFKWSTIQIFSSPRLVALLKLKNPFNPNIHPYLSVKEGESRLS